MDCAASCLTTWRLRSVREQCLYSYIPPAEWMWMETRSFLATSGVHEPPVIMTELEPEKSDCMVALAFSPSSREQIDRDPPLWRRGKPLKRRCFRSAVSKALWLHFSTYFPAYFSSQHRRVHTAPLLTSCVNCHLHSMACGNCEAAERILSTTKDTLLSL